MLCIFQCISEDRDMNSNFTKTNIIYFKSTPKTNGAPTFKNDQFENGNSIFF